MSHILAWWGSTMLGYDIEPISELFTNFTRFGGPVSMNQYTRMLPFTNSHTADPWWVVEGRIPSKTGAGDWGRIGMFVVLWYTLEFFKNFFVLKKVFVWCFFMTSLQVVFHGTRWKLSLSWFSVTGVSRSKGC